MSHKIQLTNGSYKILEECLNAIGWAKSISDIMLSGGVLSKLPEQKIPEGAITQKDFIAWQRLDAPIFEVSDKERETIRKCLTHFTTEGKIPASVQSATLFAAFGFEA